MSYLIFFYFFRLTTNGKVSLFNFKINTLCTPETMMACNTTFRNKFHGTSTISERPGNNKNILMTQHFCCNSSFPALLKLVNL